MCLCVDQFEANLLSLPSLHRPYIAQDFPFGEKVLKLSSGEVVQTPNVIRMSVNERIINQYLQYYEESRTDK